MTKQSEMVGLDLDLLYAVTQSQSTNDLCAAAERFCAAHEFSFWVYGLAGPDKALTNYPPALVAAYAKNCWHRGCDPVVNAVNRRRRSVSWNLRETPLLDQPLSAVQKNVMAERWDVGARAGVSAPVYDRRCHSFDYAVVSFSREASLSEAEQRHHEPRVQLFAAYFQSVAPALLLEPRTRLEAPAAFLSPRERDCLTWAAKGKSNWEIGQLLTISIPTVKFHMTNAARKLDANGRALTIARAIRLGLINPS